MLVLCEPPQKSSSHSVSVRFSEAFERLGVRCRFIKIGPEWPIAFLQRLKVPRMLQVYYACFGRCVHRRVSTLQRGDIAWVYTNHSAINPFQPLGIAGQIRSRGARHVFVLMDGWFQKAHFKTHAESLVAQADLTAAITPRLEGDVREFKPNAPVALFEEAIDTDVVRPEPSSTPDDGLPRVVWTGSAGNLKSLLELSVPSLSELYRQHRFVLRVVGASGATLGQYPFPVEHVAYRMETEGAALSAGSVALGWSRDVPYVDRKGHYKLKTYFAAGVPVVTNPMGYATNIVEDGVTGYFASTEQEYVARLSYLLKNPESARAMGTRARKVAEERYSYTALAPTYLKILAHFFPDEIGLARQQRNTARN